MSPGGISAYKSAGSITLRYIDVDGVVSVQSTIVGSQYDRYLQFELITLSSWEFRGKVQLGVDCVIVSTFLCDWLCQKGFDSCWMWEKTLVRPVCLWL